MQECWPWNLFVNHHGQSGEWRLRFPTPVLSSTALTAFILPLSNGVQWNQGVKGTICCRITECAELGGTCALRLPFSRLQLVILIPPPHQMDSWILYPLFPELSHRACLKLSLTLFNFYNFPSPYHSPLPGGVFSILCSTQAGNYFGNILPALSHKELNITLKRNLNFFFNLIFHGILSASAKVPKWKSLFRGWEVALE